MTIFNKNKESNFVKDFWGDNINPKRDWIILLFVFVLLFIIFGLVNFKIYKTTSSDEFFIDISKDKIVVDKVEEKKIESAISIFEEKRSLFDSVKTSKLIDPSL